MHRKDLRVNLKVHNRIAKYLGPRLPVVTCDTVLLPQPERPRRGPHVVLDKTPLCDGSEPHPMRCALCPIARDCKSSIAVD
jgi:hypothetical protein